MFVFKEQKTGNILMVKRVIEPKSDFEARIMAFCSEFGGMKNFHIHGDRAYTRDDKFYAHIGKSVYELERLTLPEKQELTWALHRGSAFCPDCITERLTRLLTESEKSGVVELHTTTDVTYNTKLTSFNAARKLAREWKGRVDLKVGAYNPSGFRKGDSNLERFELFEEAAKKADFLVALAEKDRAPQHIGERQHNFYMLNLAYKFGKPVQFHVGQENRFGDVTVETLLQDIETVQDIQLRIDADKFPPLYIVHAISPFCKSEEEIDKIIRQMAERRIGLICCPRAAISMLQDRKEKTPTHNSVANIWRFAAEGVPVYLGIDNLHDIYVPASSADPYDEAECVANALRYYRERLIAKVLCGMEFDPFDRGTLKNHLSGM